jgi:hypothetical protein
MLAGAPARLVSATRPFSGLKNNRMLRAGTDPAILHRLTGRFSHDRPPQTGR